MERLTPLRVIFDLDGTLVDSAPSLCHAGNAMIAELGRAPVDVATYKTFVGRGMRKQIEGLLAHTGGIPEDFEQCLARFRAIYDANPLIKTVLYPHVLDALAEVQAAGHSLGICTQKPEAPARFVTSGLGLMPPITGLTCGDTLDVLKPDPAMLWHAAEQLPAGRIVFVGDSETDAQTALNADVHFVLHTKGYRKGEIATPYRFDDWAEFPAILQEIALAT
ncbi:phosphoglycolate phosphatase [Rubricella aquisinus]|uniref:phosphoglycolate phosphatase n=1 Tax=Rubricella aquisinus TaxID=2028108 RepID=A0A840WMC0_9RHOB|nr:HAD-IA family hydrolase [Rubricella aquisinus]MBB5516228.1 phosphoglycolate phosphatase [Rubricella aquisinus]